MNKRLLLAGGFILFSFAWYLIFPQLYPSFTKSLDYQASVLSIDNFFDAMTGTYTGAQQSVTSFSYYVHDDTQDTSVNNHFSVRTIEGDVIVDIDRNYQVNPRTGMHTGEDDLGREGYLFAPKGLEEGDIYEYWHVNYATPITMEYAGQEEVLGLEMYRYESSFTVDQTQELSHLEGVPERYGMNLDVDLTVWVEPQTGYLVHYQDEATVYYYDQSTGERTHPWNRFNNRYTFDSIANHVNLAKERLWLFMLLRILPAVVLAFLGLLILIIPYQKTRKWVIGFGCMIGILVLGVVVWTRLNWVEKAASPNSAQVISTAWIDGPALSENYEGFVKGLENKGYIEGENLVLTRLMADGSVDAQQSILTNLQQETFDLLFAQTTTTTLMSKDSIDEPIIFSVVTHPVEAGLIQSVQNSGNHLVGTRNWIPGRDQLSLLHTAMPDVQTIGFLRNEIEKNSQIQFVELQNEGGEFGMTFIDLPVANTQEMIQVVLDQANEVDAFYFACDGLVDVSLSELLQTTDRTGVPEIACMSRFVEEGAAFGVVADMYEIGVIAGEKAGQVLQGVDPASLETNVTHHPMTMLNVQRFNDLEMEIPHDLLVSAELIM